MSAPEAAQRSDVSAEHPRRRRVIAFSALAVLFALAFECTVRIEDYLRYGIPFNSPARSVNDLMVRDAVGMHGRPDAVFEKWRMNNLGTRGPDVVPIKALGTIRVIVVGASESFGLYESPQREFPRVVEQRLNEIAASRGCADSTALTYQVLNAALPGMTLPTIAQDVRLRLASLEPDLIVVYPTPVQYLDGRLPVVALPDSTGRDAVMPPWASLNPRSAARLRSAMKSILHERLLDIGRRVLVRRARTASNAPVQFATIPVDRLERYSADLERLLKDIERSGARAIVVAHLNAFAPNSPRDPVLLRAWERFYPQATGEVIVAFDSAARPLTGQLAASSGARFVDATDALAPLLPTAFADYAHFTDVGARALGEAIADGIMATQPDGSGACPSPAPGRAGVPPGK